MTEHEKYAISKAIDQKTNNQQCIKLSTSFNQSDYFHLDIAC